MKTPQKPPLTEAEQSRRGKILGAWLGLKHSEDYPDRWKTDVGTKTDLGLYRTVKRLVEAGE